MRAWYAPRQWSARARAVAARGACPGGYVRRRPSALIGAIDLDALPLQVGLDHPLLLCRTLADHDDLLHDRTPLDDELLLDDRHANDLLTRGRALDRDAGVRRRAGVGAPDRGGRRACPRRGGWSRLHSPYGGNV